MLHIIGGTHLLDACILTAVVVLVSGCVIYFIMLEEQDFSNYNLYVSQISSLLILGACACVLDANFWNITLD